MIGRFYEGQAVSFYLRNAGWVHAIILDILDDDFAYIQFNHPLKDNIELKKVIEMTRLSAGWTTLL
jgi:hypothetical protein